MAALSIYVLCALTSLTCAVLLLRSYASVRTRLLFWSSVCFICIFLNNIALILDVAVFPDVNLTYFRLMPLVIGGVGMIYGLIWDSI